MNAKNSMNAKQVIGIGLALGLGACASTPPVYPALESARQAVHTAESDPNVNKYDALDLDAARKQLQVAETAAVNKNADAIAQPSYLATQTARLAQARAAAKADDARVAAGQAERDQIQLAARAREANTAIAQRDQARDQTAEAQAQAAQVQAQAAEQAARLQAEIDQLKATPTPRGLVLTLGDVLFDTGKSELKPGAARKMDQLAQFLSEHPNRRVEIDGFTDSVGSDSYNEELSLNRADSVKSALLARGIDGSRIATEGYGKAFPVATNNDPSGRQQNRRVEVVIGSTDNNAIAPRS
jgi:outer membrane protein OmpA-like peptidoglycan-associated protein